MMKVILAFVLVFALTYSVSTETIICFSCTEFVTSTSKFNDFLTQADELLPSPTDKCQDPMENSTTEAVDNTQYSCAEIVLSAKNSNQTVKEIIRGAIPIGSCPDLEDRIEGAWIPTCDEEGLTCSVDCSECTSDRCNVNLPHTPPPPETCP